MARPDGVGVVISPRWRIVRTPGADTGDEVRIVIDPGPGFGDGTHETTQLCLQAIAALAPRSRPWRMLDFGSGSGILGIGAAKLGAVVDAVEIDALAGAHGERNARANWVDGRIRDAQTLEGTRGPFDFMSRQVARRRGPGASLAEPRGVRPLAGERAVLPDVADVAARPSSAGVERLVARVVTDTGQTFFSGKRANPHHKRQEPPEGGSDLVAEAPRGVPSISSTRGPRSSSLRPPELIRCARSSTSTGSTSTTAR